MKLLDKCLTVGVAGLLRILLGFYFRCLERFHPERVPLTGPLLFASNHPGSVTDAFVIGTLVPRQVHFVATVQLFRFGPLARILKRCGIIPVNRLKDDSRAMRSVMDTFEACFEVFERGGAVGIFPEGISYDDSQLKAVKTGAARMTLELEHRHNGKLGLQIVPVGLTYSAKERYRSEVLIHFGEPLRVADYLAGYTERRKERIHDLSAAIEQRLRALILHSPKLEQIRIVEAVKRLYLDRLKLGNLIVTEPLAPQAEELVLSQAIAQALEFVERDYPARLTSFVRKLDRYEHGLKRLRLSDKTVEPFAAGKNAASRSLGAAALTVLGAPVAFYGWLHRLLPALLVDWVVNHLTQRETRKAQTAHAAMLSGLFGFGFFYCLYVWLAHRWFGWPVSLWYALTLPVAGIVAHYYLRELKRLAENVRTARILWRVPFAKRGLIRLRCELIEEIEALRGEYRQTLHPELRAVPQSNHS
jgi:1-acyl-sn-glycerol-3-phosphate acyltransferase